MFLEALSLRKFRSFEDERICFEKDLTILVGENNGGKSNAIDALRLITTPLSGRREIYYETADIRFGSAEPKFELEAAFADTYRTQRRTIIYLLGSFPKRDSTSAVVVVSPRRGNIFSTLC
jgi:putative ATP-dependent endonuclease of OLD family